jgi:hypothetical protein
MFPLALLSAGVGMIGGIANMFKSNSKLSALQGQEPSYATSPYAAQRLGLAQTLLNARMPGAASMERNIYGNQASNVANVNRNATSGAQALAMGSAAQGQSNQAFQGLATQEQQDYYNRLQNMTGAQQGMISEGDKVYQDQVRKYQDLAAITGAKLQNTQTAWNSLANMGIGAAGVASQMGGMFGGGGRNVKPTAAASSYMGMNPVMQGMPQGTNQGWMNPYQYGMPPMSGTAGAMYPGQY